MISPGSTIGILGGGQLGRMLAGAAAQLGLRTVGYAPAGENTAAELCGDFFENGWGDKRALAAFGAQCEVVTWEFENVPLDAIGALPQDRLAPHPKALEIAQDRLKEKRFVEQLGGALAPYAAVAAEEDLAPAVERIGAPGILKTCRDGYDGKGQWRIETARDAGAIRFPGRACVYEALVHFEAEFSVIMVRARDGEVRFWDSSANVHEKGMLKTAQLPAGRAVEAQLGEARALAQKLAEALNYVGVLTLEFFATAEGPMFNEMAPRVHNSGHWTIEGAATSQFENHIRAICGLPLGDTATRFERIEMRNIIGAEALSAYDLLDEKKSPEAGTGREVETHLHLYGKREARERRKMGHVTRIDRNLAPAG